LREHYLQSAIIVFALWDFACAELYYLTGELAWNLDRDPGFEQTRESWSNSVFKPEVAGDYLAAVKALAAPMAMLADFSMGEGNGLLLGAATAPVSGDFFFPALFLSTGATGKVAVSLAEKFADQAVVAEKIASQLADIAKHDTVTDQWLTVHCNSLAGTAAYTCGILKSAAAVLQIREAIAVADGKKKDKAPVALCEAARESLIKVMAEVEKGKPAWMASAVLSNMSIVLMFLDQLRGDLKAVAAGRKGARVRWELEV
jgi:hypothetical protein